MTEVSSSLRGKTISGVSWSVIDNISNYGVSFIVGIVLARLLSPSEYGLIGIVSIFIALFNTIIDSGFSNALIRKNNATDVDYNTIFYTNLSVSVILYLVLYLLSPYIAVFFGNNVLIPMSRVIGIVLVINALSIIHKVILTKRIDFKSQTKISLLSSIPSGIIGIVLAYKGYGVWSLVAQQIVRQLLNGIFLWVYSGWKPKLIFSRQSFSELFHFGSKLLISGIIDSIWRESYQIVIGKFYKLETLGLYTRAMGYASLFSSNLTSVVQRVSFPVLSSIQNQPDRLKYAYKKIIKVTMLCSFSLMLGLAAVSKPLILVLIGDKWLPCVPFLQILCFNMMLYPLHAINLNMLQVQGRSDLFLKLEIIKKAIALGPLLLGIFIDIYYMLFGSFLTGLIAYYLNSRYSGVFLSYSVKEQIKDILPGFFISLFMAVIVYVVSLSDLSPYVMLPLQIVIGFIVVVLLCEKFKLNEYLEIKKMLLDSIHKFLPKCQTSK